MIQRVYQTGFTWNELSAFFFGDHTAPSSITLSHKHATYERGYPTHRSDINPRTMLHIY